MANKKDKVVRIEAHLKESDADKLSLIAEEQGRSRKNYVEFLLLQQIKNWEKEQ
jgi:hypothetical protein